MDFGAMLRLLPTLLAAIDTVKSVGSDHKSGKPIIDIVRTRAPEVIELVTKVGGELFPNLPQEQKIQAGAIRLDRDAVKEIQTQLNARTNANLDVDGYYGPATKAAVKSFQMQANLVVDGWAGPATLAALEKAAQAPSQK